MKPTRRPCVALALAAVGGVLAGEWLGPFAPQAVWWVACAVTFALALRLRRTLLTLAAFALAFAVLHQMHTAWSPGARLSKSIGVGPWQAAITGEIADEPKQIAPRSERRPAVYRCRIDVEALQLGGRNHGGGFQVSAWLPGPPPEPGTRIEARGELKLPRERRNPGEFDRALHSGRQGIFFEFTVRERRNFAVLSEPEGIPRMMNGIAFLRNGARKAVTADLNDEPVAASLISGMVLGADDRTPEDIREIFRRSGTVHLLAVSGLHVVMFAAILWAVLSLFALRPRAVFFIMAPGLLFYAVFTGLQPSVMRAVLMALFAFGSVAFARKAQVLNSLGAAAVLILAFDSGALFEIGFQFSFLVVMAIVVLTPWFENRIGNPLAPDPFLPEPLWRWDQRVLRISGAATCGAFAVSLAAWLGGVPSSLFHFNLATPVSLFANVLAIPPSFLVLTIGIASALSWPFFPGVSILLNNANLVVCKAILGIATVASSVPGGNFHPNQGGEWSVTVFDLGDGGSVFLTHKGRHWLIDAGSDRDAEYTVLPALTRFGVDRLEGLLLTHGDAQHIGGGLRVAKALAPGWSGLPGVPDRSPARNRFEEGWPDRVEVFAETQVPMPVPFRVLYPSPEEREKRLADDKAVIGLMEIGGVRILLLSDAGLTSLDLLMQRHPGLRADIVIKGAHSEDGHGDPGIMRQLGARVILVSSSTERPSEMMRTEWVAGAELKGARVWRLDETGAVTIRPAKGGVTLDSFTRSEPLLELRPEL